MGTNIRYRTVRNTDFLGVVSVWNHVGEWFPLGLRCPLEADLFVHYILSNYFFDPRFFIVAVEQTEEDTSSVLRDGTVVGFIHGGFAPNAEMGGPDYEKAVVAMLLVEKREDQREIATHLLYQLEHAFQKQGSKEYYAGAVYPNAPFYIGLLPGGELCGFLENDPLVPQILQRNGYQPIMRYHQYRILLADFHFPMTGKMVSLMRRYRVYSESDAQEKSNYSPLDTGLNAGSDTNSKNPYNLARNPWEASVLSDFDWIRYDLLEKGEMSQVCGSVIARRIQSQSAWSNRWGLHNLWIHPEFRNRGLTRFLISEVMNRLKEKQISPSSQNDYVELQIAEDNVPAIRAFENLEFERFATGVVFQREGVPEENVETDS